MVLALTGCDCLAGLQEHVRVAELAAVAGAGYLIDVPALAALRTPYLARRCASLLERRQEPDKPLAGQGGHLHGPQEGVKYVV